MVDIIIPAYNAHETIMQTLSSIAYQRSSDLFKVYIVNDASDKDYSEEVKFFSKFLDITELDLADNLGPGVARQCGIDFSYSDYIMFIDADDVLASPVAVINMLNEIFGKNADVLISNFVQETDTNFENHVDDTIWMHGKMYRRKYLIDNNIRFNQSRFNEDNGFNQLMFLLDPVVAKLDETTYIWKYNPNSITHINDSEYKYTGLSSYVYNINYALSEAIKRNGNREKIAELAYSALIASYCYYLQFSDKKKEMIQMMKLVKETKKIFSKFNLSAEKKKELFNIQLNTAIYWDHNEEVYNQKISFDVFLKMCDEV